MLIANIVQILDEYLDEEGVSVKMDVDYLREYSGVINSAFMRLYVEHEIPMYNIICALDQYTTVDEIVSKILDAENSSIVRQEMKELHSSKSLRRKSI
jgi:hypothetical protein